MQNEGEWRALCRELLEDGGLAEDPRFATNGDRVAHREELDALIAQRTEALDVEALLARLHRARIAVGRLRTVDGLLSHPAIVERERRTTIDSPVGTLDALLPPIGWSGQPARMGAIPALGEHTEAVLAELEAPPRVGG